MKTIATPEGYKKFQLELKDIAEEINRKKNNFSEKYPMRKPL